MPRQKVGEKIRAYRRRAGYSQFDLEIELDAAAGSLSRIENGFVNPTKETLKRIARVLDLSLTEQAALFDIEISSILVENSSYSNLFPIKKHAEKWLSGDMKGLYADMSTRILDMDIHSLLGFAYLNLEMGDANNTRQIINQIKKNSRLQNTPTYVNLYINLIEAEIDILNDAYSEAISKINHIILSPLNNHSSFLLGKAYYLLGLIDSQHKNTERGLKNMSKALEYFDILRHPAELGKTYLYMTDFLEFNEHYDLAEDYYSRAENVFDQIGNNYLLGWCTGGKAFNKYIQGDINSAIEIANKAMRIDRITGSNKQLYYSTSILAKCLLLKGNYKDAYSTYDKSLRLENSFRAQIETSTNNLYKLFIKSRNDQNAMRELEKIVFNKTPSDITKKYLAYTAEYLFSNDDDIKKSGEQNLLKLKNMSNYKHFKNAIDKTLVEKTLQPIAA